MLSTKRPYFLENEEWYYYDGKKNKLFLTDKAPEEAKKDCDKWWEDTMNGM